ncbi:MAG: NAD(+)/NADH kinase [Elusimicrobia bacterium]|nr:NAD(+)/NADH kinase [Elusimicrobiota bacterium]
MILIFYNHRKPLVRKVLPELQSFLEKRRRATRLIESRELKPIQAASGGKRVSSRAPAQLAISLGGDGTLLAAAREVFPGRIPMMGINLGGLGFLSAADHTDWRENLELALEERLPKEERMVLDVELNLGRRQFHRIAINDCVIRSGRNPRMLEMEISSDRHGYLARVHGDGLIGATPTGSSAYALAAGGPLVDPQVPAFLVVPLASHSLTQRPLLIDSAQALTVKLCPYRGEASRAAVVLDGQLSQEMADGDWVILRRHHASFILLRSRKHTYFDFLREKLHWAA